MNKNKLTVTNRPVQDVFAFCINPANTPKWIDSIVVEQTNEWPAKLGTIYKNQSKSGDWSEYKVVEYEPNKKFTMVNTSDSYSVHYTFKPISSEATELEYYEQVDDGQLDSPFTRATLDKLKAVIEEDNSTV